MSKRSIHRRIAVTFLIGAAPFVFAAACAPEDPDYPPPHQVGLAATSSSSGGTSNGDEDGGSSTGTDPFEFCACVAALRIDTPPPVGCNECIGDKLGSSGPCGGINKECIDDAECTKGVNDCFSACNPSDPKCWGKCITPAKGDSPSVKKGKILHRKVFDCACPKCSDECVHPEKWECSP